MVRVRRYARSELSRFRLTILENETKVFSKMDRPCVTAVVKSAMGC